MSKRDKIAATVQTIRCAIYTRKSTEEGLDQEFNSLTSDPSATWRWNWVARWPNCTTRNSMSCTRPSTQNSIRSCQHGNHRAIGNSRIHHGQHGRTNFAARSMFDIGGEADRLPVAGDA